MKNTQPQPDAAVRLPLNMVESMLLQLQFKCWPFKNPKPQAFIMPLAVEPTVTIDRDSPWMQPELVEEPVKEPTETDEQGTYHVPDIGEVPVDEQ